LPWALAGAAFGALVTVVAMRAGGASAAPDQPVAPFASGATGGGSGRPPDISQMSTEEQDSVLFFLPMALGAYDQLPALDADARYHVGLLHLAGGDVIAALTQADTIQRAMPSHLFIYILRAHAYQAQGNTAQEQRAYADFLRHEQSELALKRPEYDDHREALTNFHSEALRQAQNPRRPSS